MKKVKSFGIEDLNEVIDQVPGMAYQFQLDINQKFSFNYISKGIKHFGSSTDDLNEAFNYFMQVLHPDDFERFVRSVLTSAETMSEWHEVFRYYHPVKGPSWLKGRSFPEKQTDGTIIWNGFLNDVTEEKMLEHSLKQAVEVRDAFISIASHELKTPLTVLLMQLQMIKRKYQDVDELSLEMNKAIGQIDKITRQINNFFDSTQKNNLENSFESESYDLSLFIKNFIQSHFLEFKDPADRLQLELGQGIYTRLPKDKISQILNNIILNSIKYAPQSKVFVSLKKTSKVIDLIIADNGPGIPETILPNIFSRYQKSGNEYSISGIGLGLFVTKKLADLLNAKIELLTGPDSGTTIHLQFPIELFLVAGAEKEN